MTQILDDSSDPGQARFCQGFRSGWPTTWRLVVRRPFLHGSHLHWPQRQPRYLFGYGTNTEGVLQIVDRDKLLNGPQRTHA
jgi:hypothetical protein